MLVRRAVAKGGNQISNKLEIARDITIALIGQKMVNVDGSIDFFRKMANCIEELEMEPSEEVEIRVTIDGEPVPDEYKA